MMITHRTVVELPHTFRVEETRGDVERVAYFPKSQYTRDDALRLAFQHAG